MDDPWPAGLLTGSCPLQYGDGRSWHVRHWLHRREESGDGLTDGARLPDHTRYTPRSAASKEHHKWVTGVAYSRLPLVVAAYAGSAIGAERGATASELGRCV
jgi:hypothetical protein